MATLTVWKFDTPPGADDAERRLLTLSKEGLINIDDAATVELARRPARSRRPDRCTASPARGRSWASSGV
jgi:uncharacterized membrane protein